MPTNESEFRFFENFEDLPKKTQRALMENNRFLRELATPPTLHPYKISGILRGNKLIAAVHHDSSKWSCRISHWGTFGGFGDFKREYGSTPKKFVLEWLIRKGIRWFDFDRLTKHDKQFLHTLTKKGILKSEFEFELPQGAVFKVPKPGSAGELMQASGLRRQARFEVTKKGIREAKRRSHIPELVRLVPKLYKGQPTREVRKDRISRSGFPLADIRKEPKTGIRHMIRRHRRKPLTR
ncbi:hypothetical protein KKG83_02600 [Candidatus Micrarchaeota archaeon]|nr:hypothetical protein [Candidatus Micrarchaeota archaeon]MBU2476338.1 hypothetical protein [Candidatus Micrarchaeota archaeon]